MADRFAQQRMSAIAAHVVAGDVEAGDAVLLDEVEPESLQVREATPEEISEANVAGYVFGGSAEPPSMESRARVEDMLRRSDSWNIAAFSSTTGSAVAQLVSMPWKMAPGASGAAELVVGAVTMVGTLPEYRRRGFLRKFMTQLFAELRRTGQPVAGLWASMAAIYQRYGYSQCTAVQTYQIDTVDIKFHDMDGGSCTVSRVPMVAAMPQLELLYREWSRGRICAPSWEARAKQWAPGHGPSVEEGWGGPTSTSHVAVAIDSDGAPRGYLVYNLESGDSEHRTRFQQLTIGEMIFLDTDAYRSLWSFIARHDLVGRVKHIAASIDDPATELFLEPRLLHMEQTEGTLWRIVDVAPALMGRCYPGGAIYPACSLQMTVHDDDLAPWNNGTFLMTIDSDGVATVEKCLDSTSCEQCTAPTIRLGIKALAPLWSGFRSAVTLSAWGLLKAESKEALWLANAVFATEKAPHVINHF